MDFQHFLNIEIQYTVESNVWADLYCTIEQICEARMDVSMSMHSFGHNDFSENL